MSTKHNEYGAELFITAMKEYDKGTGDVRAALRKAAKGYGDMHVAIVKANGGKVPSTNTMKVKLKAKLTERGPFGDNIPKWLDDRHQRAALLWMRDNPEQVEHVFSMSEAATPVTVRKEWTRHFRKLVKAGYEENETEGGVAPKDLVGVELPKVTAKDVEAEFKRLDELKAKRLAKAKANPTPEPTPEQEASAIKSAIDHADLEELDLLERLIAKRKALLTEAATPATQYRAVEDDPELSKLVRQRPPHNFVVTTKAKPNDPVVRFRVVNNDHERAIKIDGGPDLSWGTAKQPSARSVKLALRTHIVTLPQFEGCDVSFFYPENPDLALTVCVESA